MAVAASFYYCFKKGRPYSDDKAASPTAAFDYILYLGCAFIGIEFGTIEAQFHLLERFWDYYLLASACLFLFLAYRFDNRFVLSMAVINLGGWVGLRLEHLHIGLLSVKTRAILYAALLVAMGKWLERRRIKPHFTDTYLLFGLHLLFWTLLADVGPHGFACLEFPLLAALSAGVVYYAYGRRRFDYFLYAVVYGYIGLSAGVTHELHEFTLTALYFIASATAVVVAVFRFRRSLEQSS